MRWLFHVVRASDLSWGSDGRYAPASLLREGFIHASYKEKVVESARLYFTDADGPLRVLAIDPRRLDVSVKDEPTPRGPMPHVFGSIPVDAVRAIGIDDVETHPDVVRGTRFAFAAFEGMTLLDLVGPFDVLSRIATMGFDDTSTCEVIALTRPASHRSERDVPVWSASGATLVATRYRPPLDKVDGFDVLVIPGGPGARSLQDDRELLSYLESFPKNRLVASVCTGSLVLGALGRLEGKRATTHHTMLGALEAFGATVVRDRVVDEGQVVTSGGVTSGLQLGLHLVNRLAGDVVAQKIAHQIEIANAPSAT